MESALSLQRQRLLQRMAAKERRTGADVVAQTFRALGVTHVYAVGGNPIDRTLAACARAGIRVIGARHQGGAVLMSLAHNYVAGGLRSAVVVSAGPAVTNCATGLLYGRDNRWPVLVLGGRLGLSVDGAFQALDGAQLFAPIVKWSAVVTSAQELEPILSKAARQAMSGPPGPVYIDLAEEALVGFAENLPPNPLSRAAPTQARSDLATPLVNPGQLAAAAALLAKARRPALLVGKGARWSKTGLLLRRLVDDLSIPFATSPMGRGLLPDDHPLCCNTLRGRMLAQADLVLVVGARLDWTFRFGQEISALAQIIRIDIDPVEAAGVLGRGVGLHGDAAQVLEQLLSALDSASNGGGLKRDLGWLDDLRALRAAQLVMAAPAAEFGLQPMSPFEWLAELGTVLPEHAVTVLDGNVVMTAAQRMLPARHPVSRLGPGNNGCMGVGIPFAIGAKLARPDLPVVAIVGDFSFGLSAIELETAVRHRIAVVVVLANNAGSGGATRQSKFFAADHPERVLRFGPDVRHDLTMRSFGGLGRRVSAPGQLAAELSAALAGDEPVCIDVLTNEHTELVASI